MMDDYALPSGRDSWIRGRGPTLGFRDNGLSPEATAAPPSPSHPPPGTNTSSASPLFYSAIAASVERVVERVVDTLLLHGEGLGVHVRVGSVPGVT